MESFVLLFVSLTWSFMAGLRALPIEGDISSIEVTTNSEMQSLHNQQTAVTPKDDIIITGLPHLRVKRFPIPTTYPVPTKPAVLTVVPDPQTFRLSGSSLFLNSHPTNCPMKRSARRKRLLLNQDIMRELYLELVGEYDTALMAETMEEAMQNFGPLPVSHITSSSTNKSVNGRILEDIHKLDRWFTHVKPDLDINDDTTTIVDILNKLELTTTQLQQLLSIKNDMDTVMQHVLRHQRVKRDAPSTVTPQDRYCVHRGNKTSDGFLHLCTTCAVTTQLPSDRYPQYINEAVCDTTDCECFTVNGSPHGKCKTIVHHVKLLRRKAKGCRLMVQNGQQIILDNWELYDHPIKSGCECLMNKNSPYASLVSNPSSQHG